MNMWLFHMISQSKTCNIFNDGEDIQYMKDNLSWYITDKICTVSS